MARPMTSVGLPRRARPAARAPRGWWLTAALTVGAAALSLGIGLANGVYFDLVHRLIPVEGEVPRALLFSSFLLIGGALVVAPRPADYGLRLGRMPRHLPLVFGVTAAAGIVTAGLLIVTGASAYRDASWLVEVVIVPVSEELVFRAVLLTALLGILVRLHDVHTARRLAVGIDGVAFGIGHAANLTTLPASFVLPQVAFAILLGLVAASLMLRTRSVYPAVLVHAAVNAVVVSF
ncbi:MAG TPA: CPBP family intramembrane glutamic endopeptidase [Candidatus Limnocylindria bacterium]|nr:CPBP family intramembrane glutamic endopeptidase [Candidatus Limnocylindria bacterium]